MIIEQFQQNSDNRQPAYEPEPYQCQQILLRDHECFGECLNYGTIITFKKLRLIQETGLNYTLHPDEAHSFCQQIIENSYQSKKKKLRQKLNSKRQNHILMKNQLSNIYVKKVIKKLHQNNIPLFTQAAISGLSESKLKQMNQQFSIQHNRQIDYLFSPEDEHFNWIKQYMNSQAQDKLCSMKHIYDDFLDHFHLSKNYISKVSLQKTIKSLGFSYKVASKINWKATTSINKSKQYLYALIILFHIKEEREIIYIDETGIGKDFMSPKVWCLKNQTYYIDRAVIQKRINIIGTMSRDLLVYQCLRCNVNAELIKVFLIKIIKICNLKYGFRNYVLVFDNASVHKECTLTKDVLRYVNHLYLPPYSPQLNPIEYVWREFKIELSKQDCRTSMKLNQEIHTCFSKITNEHLLSHYEQAYISIQNCLNKQNL